jgi:CMP-N,N'-diacetyllegionaminic acid synthase
MLQQPYVIIPARGGSKGIPRKNIRLLNGKPLIAYTIEVAKEITPIDHIIVSTDSEEIKCVAENLGLSIPFLRPAPLASDEATSYDVIMHAINYLEKSGFAPNPIILLQPTSPFRNANHIKEALSLFTDDIDMVVSVTETKSNPYYTLFEENQDGFLQKSKEGNYTRRQDCPKVWEYNGAIYVINLNSLKSGSMSDFKKVKKYKMTEETSLDIDTELDWIIAETIIKGDKQRRL